MIRNKPHNNQLCTDLFRFISAYPVVSHFLRFAWQTTPVFIMIAVVGTLGVIANILLNAEKRTKAMAVFRLCGGKTRSVIILELVCDTAVTVISVLAATLILLAINHIFAIEIIDAQSGLFTAVYLIAISVIVSIAGSVTLVRSNMLETIRRYENV